MTTHVFILIGIFYLWGSIPTAYWYGRFFHNVDLRLLGSQNIGTANLFESTKLSSSLIVGFVDLFFKGWIPVTLLLIFDVEEIICITLSLCLLIGHNWSIFMLFKGGRGILTAIGVVLGFQLYLEMLILVIFMGFIGRILIYKDSGFWTFIAFLVLPALTFLIGHSNGTLIMTIILITILITKRLTSNNLLNFQKDFNVLIYRLLWDRDIKSKDKWIDSANR
jgi:glycerol-3-phosphate acyltransferase PlsY